MNRYSNNGIFANSINRNHNNVNSNALKIGVLNGETGPQGPIGLQGPAGLDGLTGDVSAKQDIITGETVFDVASISFKDSESVEIETLSYNSIQTSNNLVNTAFNKRLMLVCCEASGIPIAATGLSAFSFGNGSKSNINRGYGVPIPFNFDLATVSICVDTIDTTLKVVFDVVWYAQGSKSPTVLTSLTLDTSSTNYVNMNGFYGGNNAGSLCIECTSILGANDDDMEFRASMCIQGNEEFGPG